MSAIAKCTEHLEMRKHLKMCTKAFFNQWSCLQSVMTANQWSCLYILRSFLRFTTLVMRNTFASEDVICYRGSATYRQATNPVVLPEGNSASSHESNAAGDDNKGGISQIWGNLRRHP